MLLPTGSELPGGELSLTQGSLEQETCDPSWVKWLFFTGRLKVVSAHTGAPGSPAVSMSLSSQQHDCFSFQVMSKFCVHSGKLNK